MKKSINAWTIPAGVAFGEMFEIAARAGFDGVELNIDSDNASAHSLTPETTEKELLAIKKEADSAGVSIASISNSLGGRAPLGAEDGETRKKGAEFVRLQLRFAQTLGTDGILCVPGGHGKGVSLKKAYENVERELALLAKDAEEAKVYLGLENVWNGFFLSPFDMCGLIDRVGSPFVGAYFDAGNVAAYSDPAHWIDALGARIKRLHVKGYLRDGGRVFSGRFTPGLLDGDIDWAPVVSALRAAPYDGFMTAELDSVPREGMDGALRSIASELEKIIAL